MKKLPCIGLIVFCCMISSWTLRHKGYSLKDGVDQVFDEIYAQKEHRPALVFDQQDLDALRKKCNYFNVLDSVYQGGIGDTVYIEITKKNDGSTFFRYWNKKKPYHFVSGEWYIGKVSSLPYHEHPIFQKAIIDMDSTAIRKEYHRGRNSSILDSSYYQYYLIRAIADSDGLKFEGFRY